jgi:nucleotide-binding universal stress UspA family protein
LTPVKTPARAPGFNGMTRAAWRAACSGSNEPEVAMFKSILVALDGSAASNAGLKAAVQLASDQRATLVGVHVIDDAAITVNFEGGYVPPSYVDELHASLRDNGEAILAKAEAAARAAGVDMKTVLAQSRGRTIADAILGQVRKEKADAIVLGTHGRRGLARMLMGSDAEAVVRESRVPVVLVRTQERAKRKPGKSRKSGVTRSSPERPRAGKRAASPATI